MKNAFLCAAVVVLACGLAYGQQYRVIWSFGGAPNDGGQPPEGLIADKAGNLYGTTLVGGNSAANCPNPAYLGCGTVYELSPSGDGTWTETILYQFCLNGQPNNCPDGWWPFAGLVMDTSGNFYGTTTGGGTYGEGTVFELSPPARPGDPWAESVLWSFCSEGYPCPNGNGPQSQLVIDEAGNLYGTTEGGCGVVFQITPTPAGAIETLLYMFGGFNDSCNPRSGVIFDNSGNLYGTTDYGGKNDWGTVYELSPTFAGPWTERVLYSFGLKAGEPVSEVRFDSRGNLYGSTTFKGSTLFRLTPNGEGGWRHSFLGLQSSVGTGSATDPLIVNNTLYGATTGGGTYSGGTVFRVHGTTQTVIHSFCSEPNCADGLEPYFGGSLTVVAGKLYGTTIAGGAYGQGVVFEITP